MSTENGGNQLTKTHDTTAVAPRVTTDTIPWLRPLGADVWASVNPKDKSQVIRVMNVIQEEHKLLNELIGETIRVVHVVIHPAQSTLEGATDGETYRRMILRLHDGETVTCGAKGVFQSLWMMVAAYGVPPWKDGVPVVIRQKTVGKSGRWLFLELVPPETESPTDEIPL